MSESWDKDANTFCFTVEEKNIIARFKLKNQRNVSISICEIYSENYKTLTQNSKKTLELCDMNSQFDEKKSELWNKNVQLTLVAKTKVTTHKTWNEEHDSYDRLFVSF